MNHLTDDLFGNDGIFSRRPGKSFAVWESTRVWCETHPAQKAAIVTPRGTFTLVFTPPPSFKGIQLVYDDYGQDDVAVCPTTA